MAEIKLTGKYPATAIVDDFDVASLSVCRWYAVRAHGGLVYACGTPPGAAGPIGMHAFLLGLKKGERADHRDGNGLNNRRANIRAASHADNMKNRRKNGGYSTSRFKGVHLDRRRGRNAGRWIAEIESDGDQIRLGRFKTELRAALQYDRAARLFHGQFARTNAMLGLL